MSFKNQNGVKKGLLGNISVAYKQFEGGLEGTKRQEQLDSSENDSSEGVFQPNNPNCFNIYVGITRHGATTAHEVAGSTGFKHQHVNGKGQKAKNITKGQYQEVVSKTFLPEGDRLFDTTR